MNKDLAEILEEISLETGRPRELTAELHAAIIELVVMGFSVTKICELEGMPSQYTVYKWLAREREFSTDFTIAKRNQADIMAEKILEIADNTDNDYTIQTFLKNGKTEKRVIANNETISRAKLMIDSRQWLMQRLNPGKYGQQLDVTSNGQSVKGYAMVDPAKAIFADKVKAPAGSNN